MKYSVDKQDRYTLITLNEDNLNTVLAPDLKSKFIVFHNEGTKNLILDLSNVKFVDSSGLSAILTGNRLWKGESTFVLTGLVHQSVKKLIEISKLNSVLNIIPTTKESIDYIMMEELERDLNREEE